MMARRAQYYSNKYHLKNGVEMPVSLVARKVADFSQMLTQHAYMRPFGVTSMFIGFDEVKGPQLWRADPADPVANHDRLNPPVTPPNPEAVGPDAPAEPRDEL